MLNRELLENQLAEFPLFAYGFLDPQTLDFTERVRYICSTECPMHGKTWACPPAVGSVGECREKCLAFKDCLMIATITEVSDIANVEEALAPRGDHAASACSTPSASCLYIVWDVLWSYRVSTPICWALIRRWQTR